MLEHLARRIEELDAALLLTFRPAEPGAPALLLDALRQAPGALQLRPEPLSQEAVGALLRVIWPDVAPEGCAACHQASGGNPLLLAELLRELPASGPPTRDAEPRGAGSAPRLSRGA